MLLLNLPQIRPRLDRPTSSYACRQGSWDTQPSRPLGSQPKTNFIRVKIRRNRNPRNTSFKAGYFILLYMTGMIGKAINESTYQHNGIHIFLHVKERVNNRKRDKQTEKEIKKKAYPSLLALVVTVNLDLLKLGLLLLENLVDARR